MACLLGRVRGTTDIMDRARTTVLDSIRGTTTGQDFMVTGMGPIGTAMAGDSVGSGHGMPRPSTACFGA